MWLLNTSTLKLEEFHSDIPSYAILSHRWRENEELSFGGLQEPHPFSYRTGFKKVKGFCEKASKRGLTYVWADTCCVDKKSSAELSEAINSMYSFYSRAKICYVHLHDVSSRADLEQSSWFTRGWTLQELLAPSKLHFFNSKWHPVGSRARMARKIERITGIPREALRNFDPSEHSIAEKFSWSARRKTTRDEDIAYCLFGMFQINMPLLYGEGMRAFYRLQEEIMRTSTDMSIFLWRGPASDTFGMLASRPCCFTGIPECASSGARTHTELFSMSKGWDSNNAGISLEASIHPYLLTREFEHIFALHLHEPRTYTKFPGFAIFLKKLDARGGAPRFARVTVDGDTWTSCLAGKLETYLPFGHQVVKLKLIRQPIENVHTPVAPFSYTVSSASHYLVKCGAYQRPVRNPCAVFRAWRQIRRPNNRPLRCSFAVMPGRATGVHGYLLFTLVYDIQIMVCLGLNSYFEPFCIMLPFCKRLLDQGLCCEKILRRYSWISRQEPDTFEIFDDQSQMLYICGNDHCLELVSDLGLSMDISTAPTQVGTMSAKIEFDLRKFIQYFLPTANHSCYDEMSDIPREVFDQLANEVEQKINSARNESNF